MLLAQTRDAYLDYNAPEVSALVMRCQAGDLEAFDDLVARYQRYVFNLIYQHIGDSSELEDLAQEVFLRIYKFIRKYRGHASLESWIYKVVLNCCRTHVRRRSAFSRLFMPFPPAAQGDERSYEVLDTLPDSTYDPAKTVEQKRLAEDILWAVRALPVVYRDILIMREVNELSYEEIAEILGISVGTVKSRISRARDLVRQRVKVS